MQSETSFSKRKIFYPTLWKKNMARFWPIWAVYGASWMLALPLNLLFRNVQNSTLGMSDLLFFSKVEVLEAASTASLLTIFCLSILSAMAVFSYLYNNRSTGFVHALPVRREGLLVTNYLSGLSFILLPALGVFVITLLAEAALGCVEVGPLAVWLLSQVLLTLFFYSFAVFCAMFTGHILALPVFYGILSGLSYGLVSLINNVLHEFVFGYESSELLHTLGDWLSPVVFLYERLDVTRTWSDSGVVLDARIQGLGYLFLYAAVGVILAACTLFLYRRKHLEGAGDVVTVRWLRPVFKYGVAFCFAMTLGLFLYIFFEFGIPRGAWSLLVFLILGGGVGHFAAEMLLQKTFWVFSGSWKGWLVFSLVMAVLITGMELDVTGFERRVPPAEKVLSVEVSDLRTAPYDSMNGVSSVGEDNSSILAALALHQSIVNKKAEYDRPGIEWTYDGVNTPVEGGGTVYVETHSRVTVSLRYKLLGGETLTRRYTIPVSNELLKDPQSPAAQFDRLINRPELTLPAYFPSELAGREIANISLYLLDTQTGEYNTYPVPAEYRQTLMNAVRSDLAAGRLGRRYLLENVQRMNNCYYTDIDIEYVPVEVEGKETRQSRTITLQATATETIAVLREAGVISDTRVLETLAQYSARVDGATEKGGYSDSPVEMPH